MLTRKGIDRNTDRKENPAEKGVVGQPSRMEAGECGKGKETSEKIQLERNGLV